MPGRLGCRLPQRWRNRQRLAKVGYNRYNAFKFWLNSPKQNYPLLECPDRIRCFHMDDVVTESVFPSLKHALIVLLLLCCIAASKTSHAAGETGSQPVIEPTPISEQIAFLVLGIIRYSRWPEAPAQVDVCILGDVQYADMLLQATHFIGEVPVVSQVVTLEQALSEHGLCQVYYLGEASSEVYQLLYQAVGANAVITMEEENEYCSIGGMFCFHVENSKASFKINLDAISRSQVRIHPSVLRLGQYRSNL